VDVVVAQETYSPLQNVMRIRPDILIESSSHNDQDIEKARKIMEKIKGSVIVLPYFPGHSSTNIKNKISRLSKDKKIKP
jgi:bifunctional ADP-heptose synthase (sugar kinase/adenylyltransferase)